MEDVPQIIQQIVQQFSQPLNTRMDKIESRLDSEQTYKLETSNQITELKTTMTIKLDQIASYMEHNNKDMATLSALITTIKDKPLEDVAAFKKSIIGAIGAAIGGVIILVVAAALIVPKLM